MKYQRDISNIIRPLAFLLGLFVLYQVWLKPTYLAPITPPPATDTPTQAPSPSLSMPLSVPTGFDPSDVPQTRLIDPETVTFLHRIVLNHADNCSADFFKRLHDDRLVLAFEGRHGEAAAHRHPDESDDEGSGGARHHLSR